VVPLVPRPEEDEYDDVEILDVPPGFAPHDAHAQPSLLPVRTRFGVFYWLGSNWGFLASTVAMDLCFFLLNQITRSSLELRFFSIKWKLLAFVLQSS
jgi:hypothetical protein